MMSQVQILEGAIYISLHTNALGERHESISSPQAISKMVGQTGFFSFVGKQIDLEEGKNLN